MFFWQIWALASGKKLELKLYESNPDELTVYLNPSNSYVAEYVDCKYYITYKKNIDTRDKIHETHTDMSFIRSKKKGRYFRTT
jgi:hypothetical protein